MGFIFCVIVDNYVDKIWITFLSFSQSKKSPSSIVQNVHNYCIIVYNLSAVFRVGIFSHLSSRKADSLTIQCTKATGSIKSAVCNNSTLCSGILIVSVDASISKSIGVI